LDVFGEIGRFNILTHSPLLQPKRYGDMFLFFVLLELRFTVSKGIKES
jgi:hypothetical protein